MLRRIAANTEQPLALNGQDPFTNELLGMQQGLQNLVQAAPGVAGQGILNPALANFAG